LLLIVGVRQYRAHEVAAGTDVERGAPEAAAGEGVALVAPSSGAVPAGAAVRFVWRTVPQATRYELEVLAPDGTVAVAAATADTAWLLTNPRPLALGVTYQWWVRVVGDAGAARRSPLRALRVVPR
ncbi:MAG TPA: hypothetical protein VGD56_15985, partial [Gemmatirosa sp.]